MPKVIDMTGQKIGKLTVIERDYNYSKEHNLSNGGVIGSVNVIAEMLLLF